MNALPRDKSGETNLKKKFFNLGIKAFLKCSVKLARGMGHFHGYAEILRLS